MNLKLTRFLSGSTGIFGKLLDDRGNPLMVTLEHAYPRVAPDDRHADGQAVVYDPKVPAGTYLCKRGHHQLHSGPIETFEVTGVPGHQGILFHCGNMQDASEGCVLLGMQRDAGMITHSRDAFTKFLGLQEGVDEFTLTVEG
jgi:hypothetical protein